VLEGRVEAATFVAMILFFPFSSRLHNQNVYDKLEFLISTIENDVAGIIIFIHVTKMKLFHNIFANKKGRTFSGTYYINTRQIVIDEPQNYHFLWLPLTLLLCLSEFTVDEPTHTHMQITVQHTN
jgi:hypothetical protein